MFCLRGYNIAAIASVIDIELVLRLPQVLHGVKELNDKF